MPRGAILKPWTSQPPSPVTEFDRSNYYGAHALWACVPGWYRVDDSRGFIRSIGQEMSFPMVVRNTGSGTTRIVTKNYGGGVGKARALRLDPAETVGYHPRRDIDDLGIHFPDPKNFSIYALVYVDGDGTPAGSDSRFIAKDSGWATVDHDLMLGITAGANRYRARVRIGGSVQTLISPSDNTVQNDALALVSLHVRSVLNNAFPVLRSLTEDGNHERTSGSGAATGYTPRTTTNFGFGCTSGDVAQFFRGDLIAFVAFDRNFDEGGEAHSNALMDNIWQVFAPRKIWLPPESAAVDVLQAQVWM